MKNLLIFTISFFIGYFNLQAQSCEQGPIEITNAQGDTSSVVDCTFDALDDQGCLTLSIGNDLPQHFNSIEYNVSSIPFEPVIPFDQGTPLNAQFDDLFTETIPMGFEFCFFGTPYEELVIGSNGIITFNSDAAGLLCPPSIPAENPSASLFLNAIFAVQHDLIFQGNDSGEIFVSTIGEAPCRQFVINFFNARHFSCQETSTIQIVLHEQTNEIEVHIQDKPISCDSGRSTDSLLGIINQVGTVGYSPPNRNTGTWQASQESWLFAPSLEVFPFIQWFANDEELTDLENFNTIEVCPTETTNYRAEVRYITCQEFNYTDEYLVEFTSEVPQATNASISLCDEGEDGQEVVDLLDFIDQYDVTEAAGAFNYRFYNSLNDAQNNQNEIGSVVTVAAPSGQFFVRVENATQPECFSVATVNLFLNALQLDVVDACQNEFIFTSTTVNLNTLNEDIFGAISFQDVFYYANEQDAQNDENRIQNLNLTNNTSFWARLIIDEDCSQLYGPISIENFIVAAGISGTTVCFDGTEDVTVDLLPLAENALLLPDLSDITLSFHETRQDAESGSGAISSSPTITQDGSAVNATYFVRYQDANGCFTVRRIPFTLINPQPARDNFVVCDPDNDGEHTRNLSDFTRAIRQNNNTSVTYFTNETDALNNENNISTFSFTGNHVLFVRLTFQGCFDVHPINFQLSDTPEVQNVEDTISDICDNNNDGNEIINLNTYRNQIYNGTDPVRFRFFRNRNENTGRLEQEIGNPSNFSATESQLIYVLVQFLDTNCGSIAELTLNLEFLPAIALQPAELFQCDIELDLNESFDLTEAIDLMFLPDESTGVNLEDLDITFHIDESNALADTGFLPNPFVPGLSVQTIAVKFESQITGCFSIAPLTLNSLAPPKALATEVQVCDSNLNGEFDIDLTTLNPLVVESSVDPSNLTFNYFLSEADALANNNPLPLGSLFEADPFPASVWVRIENLIDCFDVNQVQFTFGTSLPLDNNAFELEACDGNTDGLATFDLQQFQTQITSTASSFTYYATEQDLHAQQNPITDPANYTNQQAFNQTVFVQVEAADFCPSLATIDLSVIPSPQLVVEDAQFCPGETVTISAQVSQEGNEATYIWQNSTGDVLSNETTVTIGEEGEYQLTVIAENGCENTTNFQVTPFDVPEIIDIVENENFVQVIAVGSQIIEYSIDGENWQSSNLFGPLESGVYTFYVRFQGSECIGETQNGIIFEFFNIITPNGDGLNDVFLIEDLGVFGEEKSEIKVFDRYGKVVFEQQSNEQILWDGTYRGRKLPSTSYYYMFKVPDGRFFQGWITIKNY